MNWHAYYVSSPIDSWGGLKTIKETVQTLAEEFEGGNCAEWLAECDEATSLDIQEFLANWDSAKVAAKDAGWEGDFREPPMVFWLPCETECRYGFAFKQENNGSTFVVSPLALPWLSQ